MEHEPKLVIFDVDGTLVDSRSLIVASMDGAFAALGLEPPETDATLGIVGLSLYEAMTVLLPDETEETHRRLVEAYRDAFTDLRRTGDHPETLFEGARAALEALAARPDTVLGIATGKSRRGVDRLFEQQGFESLFMTVQTADDAPSKPHPAMVEQAMASVGVEPANTVFLGDSVFDMQMARAAGARGVGVAWGFQPVDTLRQAGAGHILGHFNELPPYLDAMWRYGTPERQDERIA